MSTTAAGGQGVTVTAKIANPAYLPTRPIVRIHLLGSSMRATSYLGDDVLPRSKKARATLGYLSLAFGAPVPRARLASMLWDRVSAAQARTSFRQALSELNSAMGPLAAELITTGRATVRLNTGACWIDALALAKAPYSDSARADLAILCVGELLEGFDEVSTSFGQWLAKERIRFKQRLAGSLDVVLQRIDRGDFDAKQVAAVARRLISFDPSHRGASNALMRALAKLDEREEAIREFERHREALMKAFHVEPATESARLYETLRANLPRKTGSRAPLTPTGDQSQRNIHAVLPERNRLRIGVLPFHADDCKNERSLAVSLSHEIASALARFRWFDVITPASLRRSASRQHEYAKLDYMVDGSISGSGKVLQINVRLLDLAGQTQPVWSERFDIALRELHRLDELVTTRIVARIDPIVLHIEGKPKQRASYGATGLLLLAIPMIFSMERNQYQEAGGLIQRALALEPDNAVIEAWAAHWHLFYIGQGWAKEIDKATEEVQRHALKAINLDPENAEALGIYAHLCSYRAREFDTALLYFDRALRLNPSLAINWALSAATYCYIGEPDIALQRLERYRELASPDLYFSYFETVYTMAHTFRGDYELAVLVGRRAVKANPNFVNGYKPLVASLGHLGRRDEAQIYVRKLLTLEPNFTVEKFGQIYPIKKASDRERYMAGLRLAGIPER
jgi:DNA-binding SARP family transcriptional activator/TolB-like protein/Tfp pilus assembly protein PilF